MKKSAQLFFLLLTALLPAMKSTAQLDITEITNPRKLAQYLVGTGVIVTNATLTNPGTDIATGFFKNIRGTNINIDSGVVLTNGRAKTDKRINKFGVDNDGTSVATSVRAENVLIAETIASGDQDLANELNVPVSTLHDAVILEFDFIALGDSIRFNYVFGSEEYTTSTVCTFNDAFGFFISGPGITGKKNLALIPNTTIPVSIKQVNNIPAGCVNNPAYYIDNNSNRYFTYEGHTKVFTAATRVLPCQTYHLKLVIADVGDGTWDSGVFIEARSLSSNTLTIQKNTPVDNVGNNFLVEGCTSGSFTVKRPNVSAFPLSVALTYGGNAVNGIDVQTLPSSVTIPANDSIVTVNITPIVDNLPEGIEELTVYAAAGCTSGVPADSATVQIRDYDTLAITPRRAGVCTNSSIQLTVSAGFSNYTWRATPQLSNILIANPIATPTTDSSVYVCEAILGNCHAKDSSYIAWKKLELIETKGVICHNDTTGIISVRGGWEWDSPSQFSINGSPYQPDSTFTHLPAGNFIVRMKDASNCIDSISTTVLQLFPDFTANIDLKQATCSGNPDAVITVNATGGLPFYFFSADGGASYQLTNTFTVGPGNYPIHLYDVNGCYFDKTVNIFVNDTVRLIPGNDTTLCEGFSHRFSIVSNAATFEWTPAASLNNAFIANPVASPIVTTKYYVKASSGICVHTDSVTVFVKPAPIADAGLDTSVCTGNSVQLNGSGGIQYQWYPATFLNNAFINNPVATPSGTFSYILNVFAANGCRSIHPDTLKIKVVPVVKMFAGNDTIVAINQPVQLNGYETNNSGVSFFTWTSSYGLNNPFIAAPVATLDHDITYTLTGRTPLGCTGSTTINIKAYKGPELYVPNAFTPNGDGLNDVLHVVAAGVKSFHFFRVYDRWGQLLFSSTDPKNGWDGTIKGQLTGTGTYVWVVEAVDYLGKTMQKKGTVIIVR